MRKKKKTRVSGKDHHHDGTGQINSSRAKRSPSPILSTAQTDGPSQDTRPDVLQPPITPSLDESKQAVVGLLPRPSHKADPCASQKVIVASWCFHSLLAGAGWQFALVAHCFAQRQDKTGQPGRQTQSPARLCSTRLIAPVAWVMVVHQLLPPPVSKAGETTRHPSSSSPHCPDGDKMTGPSRVLLPRETPKKTYLVVAAATPAAMGC